MGINNANQKIDNNISITGFGSRMEKALDSVTDAQNLTAETTRNFELGLEKSNQGYD